MHTPKIEPISAPAPHIARWYVRMTPRTAVLTFEQLNLAFRQGLIDSRTLVANDALPSWTSLGKLASLPEQGARRPRDPITEIRRRAPAPAIEPPLRALEPGPVHRVGTSPSAVAVPGVSLPGRAGPSLADLAAAFRDWRAWLLAVLLTLGTLPVVLRLLRPHVTVEAVSPRLLPSLPPRVRAAPVLEPQPSALAREIPAAAALPEPLPIVRASSLPRAPARHQRQHLQAPSPRRGWPRLPRF
ncbi:MAG: hypothetical protein ABI895_41165 [Deltaproteobacteria bacterium]